MKYRLKLLEKQNLKERFKIAALKATVEDDRAAERFLARKEIMVSDNIIMDKDGKPLLFKDASEVLTYMVNNHILSKEKEREIRRIGVSAYLSRNSNVYQMLQTILEYSSHY